MLRCFDLKATETVNSLTPSTHRSNGITRTEIDQSNSSSEEETPNSSSQISTTVNLSQEYTLAVQTSSYNEIWSKIHHHQAEEHNHESPEEEEERGEREEKQLIVTSSTTHLVSQVLQPNRDLVNEALGRAKPSNLTRLVSAYFVHSEDTSRLCFILHRSVDRARLLYSPLLSLLEILPLDSLLSQPQCDRAFDIFHQFDLLENPFPQPGSDNFDEMRRCFSDLKQQLDHRLHKARKQARLSRSTSARFTLSIFSIFSSYRFRFVSSNFAKKQLHHIAQLDAAAKGTYVLNNDLDTIDRLVTRLYGVVESDKLLIRLGLERGKDRYLIHEVVKQLHKNHSNFHNQLRDLEEHLCLCFATVNRARSLLLQEINLHQTLSS